MLCIAGMLRILELCEENVFFITIMCKQTLDLNNMYKRWLLPGFCKNICTLFFYDELYEKQNIFS